MRATTTAGQENRNDNIATVFGAIFLGIGGLTLISKISGVTPSPLWLVGLGLIGVGYVGIKRAAAGIADD